MGARLRSHRKAQRVSVTAAAEAAGVSRETWHRLERGEPSVTIGAYLNAFLAVGLNLIIDDPRAPHADTHKHTLPTSLVLSDYPQLSRLAWQLSPATVLTLREAHALYERNWRHIDRAALGDAERQLIQQLDVVFGAGGACLSVPTTAASLASLSRWMQPFSPTTPASSAVVQRSR